MEIEMVCGVCDGCYRFSSDTDDEWGGSAVLFAHRFANAHGECHYMVPVTNDGELTDFDAEEEEVDNGGFRVDPVLDAPPAEAKGDHTPEPSAAEGVDDDTG